MEVSIFGLGYVGCVSIGCLAHLGHSVIGVDISEDKVDLINRGVPTIIEKDIDKIIKTQFDNGKISATTNFIDSVKNSEISIICVGTPSSEEGHLNLDFVFNSANQIAQGIKEKDGFHVIAIRSTVLPGTNLKVAKIIENISKKKKNKHFTVISNPEFLREGTAVYDYFHPPVTVLGGDNDKGLEIMSELYAPIDASIEKVDIKVAELIKYVNNSFHALKIVFANEVGNICKKLGIDSHEVMRVFSLDKQLNISSYYLKPGFAYGGSCLPKDLKALNTLAHDFYINSPVLNSIEESNANQKKITLEMILKTNKKKIGFYGISFKSGTDDLRYSPSVDLIEQLLGKGKEIFIYDRNVILSKLVGANKSYIEKKLPHISSLVYKKIDEIIDKCEVLVLPNKINDFKDVSIPNNKIIIDLNRNEEIMSHPNYNGLNW